jgi:pimeloyl-ACP methyl ester carboxylesterase
MNLMGWALSWFAAAPVQEDAARVTAFRRALHLEGKLRDVEVDGRRYAVAELGAGPPLVLLHGICGSLSDWRHLMKPLSASRRVIVPDFLGAGESDCPAVEDYSFAAHARRLRGLLDVLKVDQAVVVGNSYGGGVALRFAQDWPERVDRLVLINAAAFPEELPAYVSLAKWPCAEWAVEAVPLNGTVRWSLRRLSATMERLPAEDVDDYLLEMGRPGRRASIVRTLRVAVPADVREHEARLRALKTPALVLWGRHDRTIPIRLGRRLADTLPNARFVELDAGHIPNQEIPEEVRARMERFLK